MPDFEVRSLKTLEDFHAAEEVQRAAWNSDDIDIVPLHLMLTIAKNGGVVLGAFAQDQLVGFVLGFLGTRQSLGRSAGRLKLNVRINWAYCPNGKVASGPRAKVAQRGTCQPGRASDDVDVRSIGK
jgi:hypothetical protein